MKVVDLAKKIINKYNTELKYLIFGTLSFATNIIIYFIMTELLKSSVLTGNIVAWITSTLFAYTTNKTFVFSNSKSKGNIKTLWLFIIARLATLLIEEILLYALVSELELSNIPVKIIVTVFVIIVNYFISKYYVF